MKRDEKPSAGGAALWASAFVLLGMILTHAGRLPGEREAAAGDAAQVRDYAVLTASAGGAEDVLLVQDRGSDMLMVYQVSQSRRGVDLVQAYKLGELFTQARRR